MAERKTAKIAHAELVATLDIQNAMLSKIKRDEKAKFDGEVTWADVAELNRLTKLINDAIESRTGLRVGE